MFRTIHFRLTMQTVNPNSDVHDHLKHAVAYFNRTLFDDELPEVVIRLQRHLGASGCFSPSRWLDQEGRLAHQISVNPYFFAKRPLQDIFQTLVHQMCHLWQTEFGKPSRSGYHNLEWARKMQSIGLTPTSTGKPGGKLVGQRILDYVEPDGNFRAACVAYLDGGVRWTWLDRDCEILSEAPEPIDLADTAKLLDAPLHALFPGFAPIDQEGSQKLKMKYECPGCGATVWGKNGLKVTCGACRKNYVSRPKSRVTGQSPHF